LELGNGSGQQHLLQNSRDWPSHLAVDTNAILMVGIFHIMGDHDPFNFSVRFGHHNLATQQQILQLARQIIGCMV